MEERIQEYPQAKTAAQAEMFANRLKKRLRHLKKWAKRTGTDAFRLYDRDIPEIPLALDLYGDAVSGALYQRPYEKDQAEEEQWLAAMRLAAARAVDIDQDNIIIKRRERQRGCQYGKIDNRGLTRIVHEENLQFKVNLSDYLDTGLFLDRRAMRRMVHSDSGGRHILNLFCYTGSFSVHAAGGGAASTCSVDLSNTYLAWARENFALNGFTAEISRLEDYEKDRAGPCRHRLIRADVFAFLRAAMAARQRWDSIIIDPPTFSNSASACADFDLKRDHEALLCGCLALLKNGGKLWFSANARSFKANAAELEIQLTSHFPGVTVTSISDKTIDEDFHGRKIPKAFVILA